MQQMSLFSETEVDAMQTAKVFEDADEMMHRAPALFASTAHPKMSERYSFTNTYDIILHIHNKGFRVSSVQGGRKKYDKVMVRMRHGDYDLRDDAPEIVILDSHDGSKRLKLMLGVIRFICMNGCVAGDLLYAKSFIHLAPDLMQQVMLEIEDIQVHIDTLTRCVDVMKNYKTSFGERLALAESAVRARFCPGNEERPASFIADMREHLLHTRRREDNKDDMYTVMNVIQENILRGGMFYQTGIRVRRMQSINNVDRNVNINQTLWREAERLIHANRHFDS